MFRPCLILFWLLLCLGLISYHSCAAATGSTLAAGRALNSSERLISTNGKFALGFFQTGSRRDFSRVLTLMRGTIGYLTPEWISGVPVTQKVDVYCYGMLLLEIVSGRRNKSEECKTSGGQAVYFPLKAARKVQEEDFGSLIDHQLLGKIDIEEVERACKVACWCIQDNEFDRPTMGNVVQVLEGLVDLGMPPVPRQLETILGSSAST
ncbi:hypothetical protein PVAP13_7KG052800 [Panicum virgatum]|uniref:Protein kinase domain-containing protein n=1 Tax=Panicum virgatum TaxID=38727 RepID=A0A8T0QCM8_PANVG|nr:hypothetical protein PVAP13_7KG052800 [Panicum virgatum]